MKYSFIKTKLFALFMILVAVIVLAALRGSVNFSVSELFLQGNRAILYLRLSRIMMAIVAGSGLAVSGIALQSILRNPLAEPYILGTSSGAGLGAIAGIIIGLPKLYIPILAFVTAILTVILVYNLARYGNKVPIQSLILSGVIVSIAFSAVIIFMVSMSSDEALHGAIWWLWGSLQVYDIKLLLIVTGVVGLGILAIFIFSQDLNAISFGEEEAVHLGINTEVIKKLLFFITALITASLVSICGIIGFVGLIVPHMMRLIVGGNHKVLIPTACLGAAIFMIICDMFSRTLFPPAEVPIGVITAVVGAPLFVILLKRKQGVK